MLDLQNDVQTLYDKVTVSLSEKSDLRAISFDGFQAAVDLLTRKAFLLGKMEASDDIKKVFDESFTTIQ